MFEEQAVSETFASLWDTSWSPRDMLALFFDGQSRLLGRDSPFRISARKLRLVAVAFLRHVWGRLSKHERNLTILAERYADDPSLHDSLEEARQEAIRATQLPAHEHYRAALWASGPCATLPRGLILEGITPREQADVVRDIVGNPYRPVTLPRQEPSFRQRMDYGPHAIGLCHWLTPTVVSLAQAAYDERGRKCGACGGSLPGRPSWCTSPNALCGGTGRIDDGTLDPVRLAVLSDALEEAGCDDQGLLAHLRSPLPHYRGCWVLDLILGKGGTDE